MAFLARISSIGFKNPLARKDIVGFMRSVARTPHVDFIILLTRNQ